MRAESGPSPRGHGHSFLLMGAGGLFAAIRAPSAISSAVRTPPSRTPTQLLPPVSQLPCGLTPPLEGGHVSPLMATARITEHGTQGASGRSRRLVLLGEPGGRGGCQTPLSVSEHTLQTSLVSTPTSERGRLPEAWGDCRSDGHPCGSVTLQDCGSRHLSQPCTAQP